MSESQRRRGRPVIRVEDPELEHELREHGSGAVEHRRIADEHATKRDAAVLRALETGWTHAQIAEAAILSRASVNLIAKRADQQRSES